MAASLFVMAFAHSANAESGALVRKLAVTGKKLGIERPLGLAYRPDQDVFVIPDGPKMTLMNRRSVAGVVTGSVANPGAVAWDVHHQRLLALEHDARSIVAIPPGQNGGLDPARSSRLSAPRAGLLRAAGMTVDPATGEVFVLDRLSRRVLRFTPTEGQTPDGQWIAIDTRVGGQLAGLVYDSATKHLFTIAVDDRAMIELAMDGREVGRRDLSEAKLRDPRGLVLASSSDQTDDPAARNFFVADAGDPADHGRIVELRTAPLASRLTSPTGMAATLSAAGSPVLVQVISTAAWSPSSPDPSGIAYDSINNKLIIVDGEVEEMTIYAGKNAWETNLNGVVQRSWTTFGVFSPEPTGAAFNVDNKHLFVTDDDNRKVFEVNPGPDGLYGTSDDARTSFGTLAFGSDDPEGCSYDHVNHKLFIADGISEEIYILTPGPNGVFDGVAPGGDDVMTHFDTTQYGVDDPETVEYKEDTGTLLLVSHTTKEVVEVTETGALISTTDISFAPLQNPAGAAYAPSSFDPTKKSLYIVNRGTDNDTDPNENDGTMVEIALTGGPPPDPNNYLVLSGADDAEENSTGGISISSSDLELTFDGSQQTVGMRFSNINVPKGATITRAYVQFMTDEVNTEATNLTIQGQAADNAAIFTFGAFNISSRPRTSASASWSPVAWTTVGLSGTDQRTPELKSVIQEIVNRAGWISGNSLAIIITGTGHRTARAFEYGTGTEMLHVEFTSGPPTNTAPVVDAGPDRTVNMPASASLDGTVTDDGLPNPPAAVTVTWSKSSGPGTVTFANANAIDTQASFSLVGTYVLRLTANDSALSASDTVTVTVNPPLNSPPLVDAGPNRAIVLPASALLDGTVTDDGQPIPPGAVTVTWTVRSGPGAVTFGNANAVDTQASFVTAGTYVLRLTASDGALSASDSMTVTVRVNTAPVVDAGPNATVNILFGSALDGTVTDDGLPTPPAVTSTWSMSSGPGTVTFANANAVDTQASFSVAGTYVLTLSASDGALSASDVVTITVQPAPPPGTSVVERRVTAGSDDAAQNLRNGSMHVSDASLILGVKSKNDQGIGLRFTGLMVPKGIAITKAWIQFTASSGQSITTPLQIRGQAAGNPATFTGTASNISSRPKTSASVAWSPAAWTSGQAGSAQRTTDITSLIQEIVNRGDWTPGNPMVIILTGTGTRTAFAYEGNAGAAAQLHIEY